MSVPGPGTYIPPAMIGKDGPSVRMGEKSNYEPDMKEHKKKPGPGSYSPDITYSKKKEPNYKIGSATRTDLATDKQRLFQVAPGQYNIDASPVKQKDPQWRFGTEQRPALGQRGGASMPGPGNYALGSRVGEGPKVHMHAKTELIDSNKKMGVPGPGTYDLLNAKNLKMNNDPAYKMGTGSR